MDRFIDYSWAFTHRFFTFVGAIWLFDTLIGPQVEGEFIVLGGAALALVSLAFVKPKPALPQP